MSTVNSLGDEDDAINDDGDGEICDGVGESYDESSDAG